ncbi:helix-turn-helix transcriptional regulator [Enterococcus casseliflavus]|uniref:helix-turn-helix transcriptional regulator n=1 Tax=Enterococcus casseliflavus TaxID=37734 RepID=UPI0035CA6272
MLKDRLKELRASRKMTQVDLAKKLNVSQQTIGSWEVGRAEPSSEALTKIAALFETTVDYLLGIEDNKATSKLSPKVDTIAAHIDDNVTDQQMDEILNFIEFVKNRDHKK